MSSFSHRAIVILKCMYVCFVLDIVALKHFFFSFTVTQCLFFMHVERKESGKYYKRAFIFFFFCVYNGIDWREDL